MALGVQVALEGVQVALEEVQVALEVLRSTQSVQGQCLMIRYGGH